MSSFSISATLKSRRHFSQLLPRKYRCFPPVELLCRHSQPFLPPFLCAGISTQLGFQFRQRLVAYFPTAATKWFWLMPNLLGLKNLRHLVDVDLSGNLNKEINKVKAENLELLTCLKIWCNTIVCGRANNTGFRANRSEFYFFFYRFYYQIKGCRDDSNFL